jgi:hypothetical protein
LDNGQSPNLSGLVCIVLFLIYINDLFIASSLATFMFADDTACLACDENIENLFSYANDELSKLLGGFVLIRWQ